MSKCPQVEIQELEERLEVAAYVATERQVYTAELEARNAQLRAELVEKENAIYQYNVWSSADTVKIAKLQAEIERHKRLLYLEGWSDDRINRP